MPFFYRSGEQIERGDRVLLHGESGAIEFIADPLAEPNGWFVEKYGGGVMVVEPKVFGRLFIDAPVSDYEDLEFVSRDA
jgi:glucan biosynthesis protein